MIQNFLIKYKHILLLVAGVKIGIATLLITTYPFAPFSEFDYATNGYQYEGARDGSILNPV